MLTEFCLCYFPLKRSIQVVVFVENDESSSSRHRSRFTPFILKIPPNWILLSYTTHAQYNCKFFWKPSHRRPCKIYATNLDRRNKRYFMWSNGEWCFFWKLKLWFNRIWHFRQLMPCKECSVSEIIICTNAAPKNGAHIAAQPKCNGHDFTI